MPSPTPTNRQRNVGPVTFNSVTLNGIKSFSYDEGNTTLKEGADFDMYPTVGGVVMTEPKMTIEGINAGQMSSAVAGVKSTLVVTLRDTANGATGGAYIFTMSQAFLSPRTVTAAFNQFATQSLTFESISVDGSTHPVSITTA